MILLKNGRLYKVYLHKKADLNRSVFLPPVGRERGFVKQLFAVFCPPSFPPAEEASNRFGWLVGWLVGSALSVADIPA